LDEIRVYARDEVHVKIDSDDRGILQELSDYFTFDVPGAKFMPAYRNKMWDGKIRLFNVASRTIYKGLCKNIENFCKERDYIYTDVDGVSAYNDISVPELEKFLKGDKFKPRDYQLRAVAHALRNNRALILSPTASGKSFIIYCLIKYLLTFECKKALVIVPTTSLVSQMGSDFEEYSESGQSYYTHSIMGGQAKDDPEAQIYISTWQSIYKQPKKWFEQFDLIIGDEAHLFKANSLVKILEKMPDCKYRFGFTGTLDGTQTHKLVLEGLFGSVMRVVQTKELIENKTLSEFRIKCLVLKYPDPVRKMQKKASYQEEIDFIVSNSKRNNFIKNLVLSRQGTTLVLYQMVEKHGEVLYNLIKDEITDKRVFFIHGGVDADERERVRAIAEKEEIVIVASYGTFSTGINIRNLHNVIFASPSKSRVRNLQSIGRALRKGENKDVATLYDIADDLSYKSWHNHTLKHFAVRVKMYNEEEFDYKIYNIKIGDDGKNS
jgi:superfamily II DNA or RNA helicase